MSQPLNLDVTVTTPLRIQVGVPAEEPVDAVAVLIQHFATRQEVSGAVIGLLRFLDPGELPDFTFTVGITCSSDRQREIEEQLAAEALRSANVTTARWPITFFPPRTSYFSPQARQFYPPQEPEKKQGLLKRIFGRYVGRSK